MVSQRRGCQWCTMSFSAVVFHIKELPESQIEFYISKNRFNRMHSFLIFFAPFNTYKVLPVFFNHFFMLAPYTILCIWLFLRILILQNISGTLCIYRCFSLPYLNLSVRLFLQDRCRSRSLHYT